MKNTCNCREHGRKSPNCLLVVDQQAMTVCYEALRPSHRVLEADDQGKRLQIRIPNNSRWNGKEATSAIPSHAEKQPHDGQ